MDKQGLKNYLWRLKGLAVLSVMSILLFSCARMGQPDGGWYDEAPPKILATSPADRATDVNSKKVTILFNEFIKLDNPSEKVVVSPPQLETPEIKAQGKRISVTLMDSLKPNTTYTIDFSDAISDNNEGNPMGNYTYSFSTGGAIDTMEVAGYVLEAENLEPIKGILVGLYSNQTDTAFTKLPMLRVSRTDDKGHFSIKGVKIGDYRIYALQDADGNYRFTQQSEKIAFTPEVIMPSSRPDVRQDTLWRDSLRILDIKQTPYTRFLPDDVVLTAFTEVQTNRYFLKAERKQPDFFSLFFTYGNAELPKITGINFDATDAFVVEPSLNQDTITYWLRDTALINQDTLRMQIEYQGTDSLGALQLKTDTLEVLSKTPYAKRLKQQQEKYDKWKKQQDKNKEKGKKYETTYPAEALDVRYNFSSQLAPDENLIFDLPFPISQCDTTKIHLYEKVDTLWTLVPYQMGIDPTQHRRYKLIGEWKPQSEYSLELDSMAFTDIYGKVSKPSKQGIRINALETYSTLIVSLQGMESKKNCILQLLNEGEKVIKEVAATNNEAVFYYVKPSIYYLRVIVDDNDNGRWDTGLYSEQRQAEAVYYYTKEIECKEKKEVRLTWSPLSTPLYKQKPDKITKQKGETKRKIQGKNLERAKQLGLEYNPKNGLTEDKKLTKKEKKAAKKALKAAKQVVKDQAEKDRKQ